MTERIEVFRDPDIPGELAVSIDGAYAYGIPLELVEPLRTALNDYAYWEPLTENPVGRG